MVTRAAIALLAVFAACQGQGNDGGAGANGSAHDKTNANTNAGSGSGATNAFAKNPHEVTPRDPDGPGSGSNKDPIDRGLKDVTTTKPDEPEAPDPGKMIDSLAAIPAWEAVIDRANLLERRGQHGVVYGRVGPIVMVASTGEAGFGADGGPATLRLDAGVPVDAHAATPAAPTVPTVPIDAGLVASPYHWLVDDSDGNGALAIRIVLGPKGAAVKEGDRVALGGAWALDADHRWFWKVDAVTPLPAAAPSDLKEPPAAPGHTIVNGDLPTGARTVSVARDNDAIYFQLAGPVPADDADGWAIADQLGNPTFAILSLPGERTAYGAQDMRAPDERWTLHRGQTYWVRIGKLHKHGADKPITINARTAPIRVL